MKSLFISAWIISAGLTTTFSQDLNRTIALRNFSDSVQHVLESIHSIDTFMVGNFASAWSQLDINQKQMIRTQTLQMAHKRYTAKDQISNYFGAVINAAAVGDISLLKEYLYVAGQVIEHQNKAKTAMFFKTSNIFFREKALHIDKFFQLHILEEKYQFDYIKEPPPLLSSISEEDDAFLSENELYDNESELEDGAWQDAATYSDNDSQFMENETEPDADIPVWMEQTPQPVLTGPVIRFDRVTLHLSTLYDSVFIRDTKGTFSFTDNVFVGEGGVFNWSSVGLNEDAAYFEFQEYHFDTTNPVVKAERGELTYKEKVSGKVPGIFEFRSVNHATAERAIYPKFTSFGNDIELLGMQAYNLRYVGGFALDGKNIRSRSINGGNSRLEILGQEGVKFLAQAQSFDFNDSIIFSRQSSATIYQKRDSIYHPSVQLWYDIGSRTLVLRRGTGVIKEALYSMSYFKMDFKADKLHWDVTSDSLFIFVSGSRGQDPMVLESVDFYDAEDFRILTGQGFPFHPVVLVANYAIKEKKRTFYTPELAQYTGQRLRDIHMAMIFLAQKGIIYYEPASGLITVKDEAINIFNARKGISDYDNVKIHSVVDGPANAVLSLHSGEMHVAGIDKFKISDSLNVIIQPDNNAISLLRNRDIQFNGRITAGNFEIYGKKFAFKYDSFLIYLNNIDSIQLYVVETNQRGQQVRRRLNNSVQGVDSTNVNLDNPNQTSGTLYINKPDNKSGRKKIPKYPRLDAKTGGVIYFDKKEILNGVYDRSVFYSLPPFQLDSLNNANPASIRFKGSFSSGGMFPPFEQELYTRPDNSLGFTHTIPSTGYQLFGNEGKANGAIDLSGKGIRLNGTINYLTATLESDDFVFYPDSVVGQGDLGELREREIGNVKYPEISSPKFKLKWLPKKNWFGLSNLGLPFDLYKSTAQLDGEITLSKKGIFGSGKLSTHGFDATSDEFAFSVDEFSARNTNFQLNTADSNKPALAGEDIRLKFDLKRNYAQISPEVVGDAALEFPYAQFKTSIPEARWDLNKQKVIMEKAPNTPLEDSYFYTTRDDLDSLNFMAEKAEYDITTQQLKVSGIPFIQVADAKIVPENNEILILENAKIGRLENTSITLDTLNGYHTLIDGTIDIISRKQFYGRATYQHVNAENDTFAIKMTDFRVEPIDIKKQKLYEGQGRQSFAVEETVASGVVTKADSFILAPRIFYKGNITMYATRPALQLRGGIKLDLKKIPNYDTWIQYEQTGEEDKIFIPFDKAQTENGKRVGAGLHFDSNHNLYITFAFDKKDPYDEDFFLPSGSLFYDEENEQFRIEDRLRASGEQLTGEAFTYDESKQEVYFAGPVYFFGKGNAQKKFKLTANALGSGNLETNDIQMNTLLMIDIDIPIQALNLMATDLQEAVEQETLEEGLGDQTELLYKLANIVGDNAIENFEDQSAQKYTPLTTMPQLLKPLLFSNINLKRAQEHNAFYSTGRLGLSNILNQDINGALEGFMEMKTTEDGSPVFHVFFKAASYAWYYLGLEDNRLLIHSSNDAFNNAIAKKTRASQTKIGKLTFASGSDAETLAFINRFRKEYFNIETPFQLEGDILPQDGDKKTIEDDGF